MSKPSPARYRTTNWSGYTAALRKRGSLLIWLDKDMTWLAGPDGKRGRPAMFSDAAIQFCLTIKVLFKLPLRQTTGMVASLLKLADLDWAVSDYTTLCRRQKTLAVQIPYRRTDGPLNLLVDSTGNPDHSDPQERPTLERRLPGGNGQERNPARHPPLWPGVLEALDGIPRTKPDRGKDALLESFRRTHCGPRPGPPDC